MPSENAVQEILNFAITRETEARDFYRDVADNLSSDSMKSVFLNFAEEEEKHRLKLEDARQGDTVSYSPEKIQDLKIADYIIADEYRGGELTYQQALVMAMRREKKAFRLYTNLAEAALDDTIRDLFRFLAQEEAKHKLTIETEYDDIVLNEN